MGNLGIDYEFLSKTKPDIIMVRMPGFGLSGPYRDYRALGQHLTDVAGFDWLMGYTDVDPFLAAPATTFCDAVGGISAVLGAMMALHHRTRTGKGQVVEVAQLECLLPQLGEAFMDYTMNRRIQKSIGNRDFHGAAPSGNYRCKGNDRWISITVRTDEEWEALCRAMGDPEWTKMEEFATTLDRYQNQDKLDKLLTIWTSEKDCYSLMYLLQNKGIAAAPVTEAIDCLNDPHFREMGVLEEVTHPESGTYLYPGAVWTQRGTPNKIRRHAPRLGEDNEYVYKHLLEVSDDEYAKLEQEGHIGMDYAPHIK
jgi:crotonobetainyl-CoA:carnitine CoA-transferase CaiB-like acyl-CoA transferase